MCRAPLGGNVRPIETDGTRLYVSWGFGAFMFLRMMEILSPHQRNRGRQLQPDQYAYRFLKYVNGSLWIGSDPGSGAINFGYASLHRLTPGQTTWQKSSNGFPIGDTGNQADDIAYDASTGTYYAAAALGGAFVFNGRIELGATCGGSGRSRRTIIGRGPSTAWRLNCVRWAQVCKTTNQGTNWTALTSHQGISSGYLLEKNGRVMFASSRATIRRRTDSITAMIMARRGISRPDSRERQTCVERWIDLCRRHVRRPSLNRFLAAMGSNFPPRTELLGTICQPTVCRPM
ncbi:MAG: hypothetical protein WDN00_15920 [Limisphaerales bacterium]